jgi:cytochrome P450
MQNVLFLQSEVKDPYEIYDRMLLNHPLYYDEQNSIWAVYTFDDCDRVLKSSSAFIPKRNAFTNESREVKIIIENLARLGNPPEHDKSRKASVDLMKLWKPVDASYLIQNLIGEPKRPAYIDWVGEVSKKLPALALLKGFDFSTLEIDLMLSEMDGLIKIMLPTSQVQNNSLNVSVAKVFGLLSAWVSRKFGFKNEANINLYSANLLGLFIQSYDAGRGLLSNSLLQLLKQEQLKRKGKDYFELVVKETLRFDPPIQNTRRTLTASMIIQNQLLSEGENILVVLAAANRDPQKFKKPIVYNISRNESPQYLTYGSGAHQCVAEHFSIHLASSVFYYLFSKHDHIELIENEIHYEPRINVRLPIKIRLRIS